jgi:hypothetical protein
MVRGMMMAHFIVPGLQARDFAIRDAWSKSASPHSSIVGITCSLGHLQIKFRYQTITAHLHRPQLSRYYRHP